MNLPRTLWRLLFAVLLVSLTLAAANLLVSSLGVVLLIFAGILFGVFLNGLSRFFQRHSPLSYRWAYVLVVTVLILLIAGGFTYTGSQIAQQASQLAEELQSAGERLSRQVQQNRWMQQYMPDLSQLKEAAAGSRGLLPGVMQGVQWLMWGLTGIVVIFFVGLYVAYDPDLYETGLVKLVPPDRRKHAREVLTTVRTALSKWIIARMISMSIIGIATAVALWLLNVPLPVPLGVLAALLTFIPNIGPILAAIPQALLAMQVGTNTVLYVLLFNVALQMAESYLVTPIVERYEATLPPALTISMQLLMGVVVGVVGIVMAAPLTLTVMVLVQMLYIQDELGDPDPGQLVEGS